MKTGIAPRMCAAVLSLSLLTAVAYSQWTNQGSPTGVTGITALLANGNNLFAATANSNNQVERSPDNGATWAPANTNLTKTLMFSLAAKGNWIFVGAANGIYRTSNNGSSWTSASSGLSGAPINAIAVMGRYLFAGSSSGGVFRNADSGSSWSAVNTGFSTGNVVTSFAVSGGSIFAGTSGGAYLSTDSGAHWSAVNSGLTTTSIKAMAAMNGAIFAGTDGGGVFRSTGNGASWTAVNNGLGIGSVLAFAVNGNTLFASGNGVWATANNGDTWSAENSGLGDITNIDLQAMAVSGAYLVAGDAYSGNIWRCPLSGIIVPVLAQKVTAPIESFTLGNSIRNSSSGGAIHFSMPRSCFISLAIYDLAGRQVARLVNRSLAPGKYDATFSGASPARGTYLCILRADGRIVARSLAVKR